MRVCGPADVAAGDATGAKGGADGAKGGAPARSRSVPPAVRSLAAPIPQVGRAPLPTPTRSGRPEPAVRRTDPPAGPSDRPDLSWRRSAACLGHDVSLFFPSADPFADVDGLAAEELAADAALGAADADVLGAEQEEAARVARAKAVCATCPVQPRCLQHALEHREHHGIWGGTTEAERRRILRRRRRRTTGAG